jgi:molecular chaperone GrpE
VTGIDDEHAQTPPVEAEPGPADATDAAGGADTAVTEDAAAEEAAPPDERYLRLAADFENFRRRKNQELLDRSRYASEAAARALLPVLDNLHRALDHAPESSREDLVNGLELVVREFESRLEDLGVSPIEALGRPFDPAVHEALGGEDADGVDVDTVNAELQRGYRLHDRVLRPALVRVAHPRPGRGER